jgi:hypothetical protein
MYFSYIIPMCYLHKIVVHQDVAVVMEEICALFAPMISTSESDLNKWPQTMTSD